jgi:hypothetical protein
MSLVDDELDRHIRETLSGLDDIVVERRVAPLVGRSHARGWIVAAGCAIALAFAVVLVATRSEPRPAERTPTTPVPERDDLDRLPLVRPGALQGVLQFLAPPCMLGTIDLATLRVTTPPRGICARPGATAGVAAPTVTDDSAPVDRLRVVDLSGHLLATVRIPRGWFWIDVTRDGLIFCHANGHNLVDGRAVLRRFTGGTASLPSCPIAPDLAGGVLFRTADRRSVVDDAGRVLAKANDPIEDGTPIRIVRGRMLAIGTDLYRDGRFVASFDEPVGFIVGASDDGRVALVSDGTATHLSVYRDGVRHDIPGAVATTGGTVAPDGRHIIVEHRPGLLVELDTATLRPVGRLVLPKDSQIWDWR